MTLENELAVGAWTVLDVNGHSPPGCGGHALVLVNSDTLLLSGGADRSVQPRRDTVEVTRGPSGSWSACAIDTTLNCKCVLRQVWISSYFILAHTVVVIAATLTHTSASDVLGHQEAVCRPFELIRTGASAIAIDDCVYIFGGQEPMTGLCCNEIRTLNVKTRHWTTVCPASGKPPPRHAHTVGRLGQHSFLVFGGASQSHEYGSTVVGLLRIDTWINACTAHIVSQSCVCRVLADVWVFNTVSLEWKLVLPGGSAPAGREMAAGVMISEHQFVVIGGRGHGGVILDDVVLLDLACDPSWKQILNHDSLKRCAHSAVTMDLPSGQVTFWKGGSANDTYTHDYTAKFIWLLTPIVVTDLGYWDTQAHMSQYVQDSDTTTTIAIFGGFVGQGLSDDLVLLDAHKRTCTTVMHDHSDAWPLPRFAHAACTVHSSGSTDQMFVFGGLGADVDSPTWHVWDPCTRPVEGRSS